ncbi:MAG: hypothetical protein ABIQ95_10530, partial [Bdellovibrionia bacterium]
GGNFATDSADDDLSLDDKVKWLKANETAVRDYRSSNCGKEDQAESLQTEAILFSEIANQGVVDAWRVCMLEKLKNGLWVETLKNDGFSDDEEEVTYTVNAYFRSEHGVQLYSMSLSHTDNVTTGFPLVSSINGENKTGNILGSRWGWGHSIASGGNKMFNARHMDRTHRGSLIVRAMESTGNPIEQSVTFPKRVVPVIELVTPVEAASIGIQTDEQNVWVADQPLKSVKLIFHTKNDDLDSDSALHIELRKKDSNELVGTVDLPGNPRHDTWKDYTDHTVVLNLIESEAKKIKSKSELTLSISMTPVGKDQWIYQLDVPFEFSADAQLNHIETFSSRETIMYPRSSTVETKTFDCAGN